MWYYLTHSTHSILPLFQRKSAPFSLPKAKSAKSLGSPLITFRQLLSLSVSQSVQWLSPVWLFATPWIAACQASMSITNSRSLLMPIESVMPSSYLILCRPLLLLSPIPPSIKVCSIKSTLRMRWPKYWSFSFSISPSNEHPGLMSFRMDWLDLLAQNRRQTPQRGWLVGGTRINNDGEPTSRTGKAGHPPLSLCSVPRPDATWSCSSFATSPTGIWTLGGATVSPGSRLGVPATTVRGTWPTSCGGTPTWACGSSRRASTSATRSARPSQRGCGACTALESRSPSWPLKVRGDLSARLCRAGLAIQAGKSQGEK